MSTAASIEPRQLRTHCSLPEVVVDGRWLNTGIGTYTFNVIKSLKKCGPISLRILTLAQHREVLRPFCDRLDIVDAGMYSLAEQIKVPIAAAGAPLLHVMHYNVPLLHRGKLVVTIHDVTHLVDHSFRRTAKTRLYGRPMLRFASSRADHIITVSEYSKKNIVERLGVSAEKVSVIHCGVDGEFMPQDPLTSTHTMNNLLNFTGPYILYVGNLKPHKNVEGLLRAFKLLVSTEKIEQKLLIVGEDAQGKPRILQMCRELGLANHVVFALRVAQSLMSTLYSGADITVVPSFEEGFGLPVLESMACGTAVAGSAAASIPEVGGKAVEYFDPRDVSSIGAALQRLLSSSTRRHELIRLGLQRARQFRWEDSAREHLRVYSGVLS
jgi:glycosyltransferase involved in cell wall biosynthesis